MAQETKIIAAARTVSGSSSARRLRRAGQIPAVLATLKGEAELLQLNAHDFEREISRHASAQIVVTIAVGDNTRMAIIRELQRDGITGRIIHADFGEVDPAVKMHVHIPLLLVGDPIGVRTENGVLEQQIRSIEVVCLPGDVIEDFVVDCSQVHVGQDIKVSDLQLDATKYQIVTHAELAVATCASAITEVAAAPTEEAEADAGKGKGKKK